MILQYVINGLCMGAIYACIAAGLSLVFGVMEVVNFAHGEFYMIGAYVFFATLSITHSVVIGIICAVVAISISGVLTEKLVITPAITTSRKISAVSFWMIPLIVTLGLSLFLRTLFLVIFSPIPKFICIPFLRQTIKFFGACVAIQRLLTLVGAIVSFLALHWFIHKTKVGKAMRAISQNRKAAQVLGIDVKKVSSVTWAISGSLWGLSGALVGPIMGIYPEMGLVIGMKTFAIVIIGGFGNVVGGISAAFIIGIAESLFAGYISATFKDILVFVLMFIMLLVRPQGIFGKKVGI